VRIFLIGFSEGFTRSLARYFSGDPRVALTGVVPSLALAGIMLPVTGAVLALVDWSALGASPRESLLALRQCRPALRIVCVVDEDAAYRDVALAAGADAVTSKGGLAEELEPLLRGHFGERSGVCGGPYG